MAFSGVRQGVNLKPKSGYCTSAGRSCGTPDMGVNLWGESPLYENRMVFMIKNTIKSTSRRQWRKGDRPSEGSRSANVRDDGQKPNIRLSPRASRHNTSEAHRFGSRINAAFVHGKFTLLSGEICATRNRRFMRTIPERSYRLTKDQAYAVAVGGYGPAGLFIAGYDACYERLRRPFTDKCNVLMYDFIVQNFEIRFILVKPPASPLSGLP